MSGFCLDDYLYRSFILSDRGRREAIDIFLRVAERLVSRCAGTPFGVI
jgi:hypothetical protein